MSRTDDQATAVRAVIERLIENVSANTASILNETYHDDMTVIMLSPEDKAIVLDKQQMTETVTTTLEQNNGAIGTWAKFHHVSVNGDTAHVLLSRRNELTGPDQQITLGIDLVNQDDRWQITREVIVTRPVS
ncbi:hypothetical protein [uncultured Roseibium sp.]|uniref:hypothetical protein n=1 Tax=uncultured Roseibium sp. TaxID=1936171 RepID=UPI002609502C|nr:hypothetical protein [uncultured Roseibium sp.]